jgi:hypothetical protein
MTTQLRGSNIGSPKTPDPGSNRSAALVGALCFSAVVILLLIGHNFRRGAVADRITNPGVTGAPRPLRPPLGFQHWLALEQIGTVVMLLQMAVIVAVLWRRYPGHPYLLMTFATTLIVWQDPIMNWAPYAVYNPQLWHWPETWPLASLSPTVEPFIVLGYASFYFGPFFPAIWVLRRLQRGRPMTAFVWRHPLVSLGVVIFGIGFVMDALMEILLVRTQTYIYSQVIPFGSVFTGKYYQFPLLWESTMVTFVMIPAGLLCYRDDTGKTVAEKLAQRFTLYSRRPRLATFAVMFAIANVAYFCYGGGFAIIKWTKSATSVACPYPFPEARVYDPNGFYAKAGQPGPYFGGNWSAWESAQPSGRPNTPAAVNGRCSTSKG